MRTLDNSIRDTCIASLIMPAHRNVVFAFIYWTLRSITSCHREGIKKRKLNNPTALDKYLALQSATCTPLFENKFSMKLGYLYNVRTCVSAPLKHWLL
jgi:hypothetical protein